MRRIRIDDENEVVMKIKKMRLKRRKGKEGRRADRRGVGWEPPYWGPDPPPINLPHLPPYQAVHPSLPP